MSSIIGFPGVPQGMHSDALTSGSKRRTAAKAETRGCARASRRAFDSQPRGRSHSAVWRPARRRCALATRCRQSSVRRPSVTISNKKALRSIRMRHPQRPRLESITWRNDDEEGIAAAKLVTVATPSGTLTSNVPFRVIP